MGVGEVVEARGEYNLRHLYGSNVPQPRQIEVCPARDPYCGRCLREAVVAGARNSYECAFNGTEEGGSLDAPVCWAHA